MRAHILAFVLGVILLQQQPGFYPAQLCWGWVFWAAAFAHYRLADRLPQEWEGPDIQVIGVVAELPQINERGVRFAFDVRRGAYEGSDRALVAKENQGERIPPKM